MMSLPANASCVNPPVPDSASEPIRDRRNSTCLAEVFGHLEGHQVVLLRPAPVVLRADIDEGDLHGLAALGEGRVRQRDGCGRPRYDVLQCSMVSPPVGVGWPQDEAWNVRPRAAGALRAARLRSAEMITSTSIVIR